MSKSNALENEALLYIFNASAPAWAGAGNFYLALHTADPGEAGDQTTNECAYTSYARVAMSRDSAGFTVSGNQVVNFAQIQFPQCTGGSETATHWSIGRLTSGAGAILYKGALSASLAISNLIRPIIDAGQLAITED